MDYTAPILEQLEYADRAALCYSYRLATESRDLRICEGEERRKADLKAWAMREYSKAPEGRIDYCLKKRGYMEMPLEELGRLFYRREIMSDLRTYPTLITCCGSCHSGSSSVKPPEIQAQRDKYDGLYICKSCEKAAQDIADAPFGGCKTSGGNRALVTNDGVYYDEGICVDTGRQMLGFGGRWFMVTQTERKPCSGKRWNPKTQEWEPSFTETRKTWPTNNLFFARGLHPALLPVFEDKVNARIQQIDFETLMQLKEQLNKYSCFVGKEA